MNLPKLAVDRPVTTIMLLVSITVLGGIAMFRLPQVMWPELDAPFIMVQIPYPNSNPTQVEKDITKPVEEVLATLANVKKLSSTSSADSSQFFLEFNWGQSIDVTRMQVSEKMDQIKGTLPIGVGEVLIFSFSTNDIPVVQARISAVGVDLSEGYELLETRVLNPIRRVPGVARVDLDGVAPKEIDIDLHLDKIKAHNVDVGQLVRKLRGASSNVVLGRVDDAGLRYTARALGEFDSVGQLDNLVINQQGLRLRDIADVTYEEPVIRHGRHLDGSYAIALTIYKESTANTVDTVRKVMRVINEDIGSDPLLKGISVFVWQDQADEITGGINGLTKSGMVGGLLAVVVLYFFLRRLDSTVIVAMTIPFSIIAACGVLFFLGKTLNVLSMMGLILGVGMLVDNAVVVLESIDRRHRDVRDVRRSALEGTGMVAMAVTASTLTSLIVFLPLIVGAKNDLTIWLGEVGIAISLSLICSLFASLTLIPLVSAHLLRHEKAEPNALIGWLENRYVGVLRWTLVHKVATFFIGLSVLFVGYLPFGTDLVEKAVFSATTNERLYLTYEFSSFSYKSNSEAAVDKIEEYLNQHREEFKIASLYSYYAENDAGTTIVLTRKGMPDREINELRKAIREGLPEIPGARVHFFEDEDSGGSATYFAVKFFGQDTVVLEGLANEAARRLESVPGVIDISTSFNSAQQEVQVSIDRSKARRVGMTAQDVSDIFAFTLGGMRLNRFNDGEREVETWLAFRPEDRTNVDDLRKIQFRTAEGGVIDLGDLATFKIVPRMDEIRRESRKVRVSVQATYEGESWEDTQKEITKLMDAFELPAGYSWTWNDRIVEQGQQGQQMGVNFLLALLLVYIVMASLFESLTQPFAILFAIPFAIPGAAWMLAVTKTPFNIMAQIGLLILMGIVVNNGIVLLDHLNHLRWSGLGREEAILMAGRDRLRAILMTASTTIIGLLPLAVGGNAVAGLMYFPMARTVMGGLISSTFLTLLILPYVNDRVEAFADWAVGVWRRSKPSARKTVEASA